MEKNNVTKSRPISLRAVPALADDLQKLARVKGKSFNGLIWDVMEEYRDQNIDVLTAFSNISTQR